MKAFLTVLSLSTALSLSASTQFMTYQDTMKVPTVVMNYVLPMNMLDLHRGLFFQDRMIAGKKDTQSWSDRLRTRLQGNGIKNLNAFLD